VIRHHIQVLAVLCLAAAGAWHLVSYYHYEGIGGWPRHIAMLALAFAAGLASLFLRNAGTATQHIDAYRPHLTGAACMLMGAAHFIGLLNAEPLFLQMGFMVLILAYFETAGMANGFRPVYFPRAAQVTESALKRLVLKQMGTLAMVFALSIVLLYMSLMVVVGFRETWTVALLAAAMILALAMMTRARKL